MFQLGIKLGRKIIGYNSLFVALIRYVYIVHRKKANQWEFEIVGRYFQIASIVIPVVIESIGVFIKDAYISLFTTQPEFIECIASHQGLNSTDGLDIPMPATQEWALMYVPESIIVGISYVYNIINLVVFLNVTEGFLYLRIYRCISR